MIERDDKYGHGNPAIDFVRKVRLSRLGYGEDSR